MADDNQNPKKNQIPASNPAPKPFLGREELKTIFETVPVDEPPEAPHAPKESKSDRPFAPQESKSDLPRRPKEVKLDRPFAPQELKPEEVPPDLTPPSQPAPLPSEPPMFTEEEPGSRRKYLIIGAAVLGFFLLFIFILFIVLGRTAEKKQTKLVYWGLWEDESVMKPLIDQYQAQNKNITVEYHKMEPDQYREKLIARSKNNQNPPDIFRFHNTWLPEIKEIASPIPSTVMKNTEFEQTFYPIHKRDLKVGDNYFGIPLEIDGLVLIYNDELFKKAGINTPPVSWDDIISNYVGKLTVKSPGGQIITSGMALGTASNIDHFSDIFGLFLIQNGGDIKKLDQAEAVGALQSYRAFAEVPDNIWDESLPNSITAFIQGKVAMIIVPSWEVSNIKTTNPEINLKVVPVPSIPGSKAVSIASYWVEGVSRTSPNQLEAWKFLKFLSQKENMTKLYELESKTRLFGEPYSRVDLAPLLADNQFLGPVIKQANSFVSVPTISRTFDGGLNDNIIQYIANAINATAQGVSYQEALKTAKLGADQVFSKFQIQTQQ